MKSPIAGPQFQVAFHPDGAAKPFEATAFQGNARQAAIRRKFRDIDPSVPAIPDGFSHLRSEFQIFEDQPPGSSLCREVPQGIYSAVQKWSADSDSIGVTARLRLKKGADERGVRVRWTFPHPYLPEPGTGNCYSRWRVWAAHIDAPFTDDWGHLTFTHGRCPDIATEIALPAVTLYRSEADVGFTFLVDQEVPWITRIDLDQRHRLLTFEFSHIGLRAKKSADIALRFFCHSGCWRPGLAAIQKRFPLAARPASKRSRTHEGVMAYTIAGDTDALGVWNKKMGLSFNEILHFDDFGEYTPTEPWNCRNLWSKEAPWRKVDGLTWSKLRDYVRRCKDSGVGAYLYINFADCESQLARRKFANAIMRNEWGRECITWVYPDRRRHCLMMNPDPQFGFSAAILEQASELMERLPELDGFHLDQNAYGWIDTAHDDGVTWLNDRPAYNMLLGYRRAGRLFRKLCDRHGKVIESNGIINFRQLEDVDMVMAEESLPALGRYAPICSQRALIYLATGEQGFQWSLKYGAFPHVSPYEWAPQPGLKLGEKTVAVYQAYLPILSMLRGATWVLEANCLELPRQQERENCIGNITGNFFRLQDRGWLVTLLQAPSSVLNTGVETVEFPCHSGGRNHEEVRRGFPVVLRFVAAKTIREVRLLQPGRRPVAVKWNRSGNRLEITVPQLGAFAALLLTT